MVEQVYLKHKVTGSTPVVLTLITTYYPDIYLN